MRKQTINENWELEEVVDLDDLAAVLFKYGSNQGGYAEAFDFDDLVARQAYDNLVNQYKEANADELTHIYLVKLPNTPQVISLLDKALYNGNERDPEAIEAVNNLCNRADCETLDSWGGCLSEGKKKKKVYSSAYCGFTDPELNIKHFNKCMGTGGLQNPDSQHLIVGDVLPNAPVANAGSSSSDGASDAGSSAGEGGAVGESLNEDRAPVEIADMKSLIQEIVESFEATTEKSSKLSLVDMHANGEKKEDVISWVDGNDEKHITEHYNFTVSGGLNGSGEWGNYLDDLSDLAQSLKKQTGWEPVVIEVNTDTLDDLFYVEFNLFNPNKVTQEELKESLLNEAHLDYNTQYGKMKALENRTRGFNAASASDEKLEYNWRLCKNEGFKYAQSVMEQEMLRRGGRLANLVNQARNTKIGVHKTFRLSATDFSQKDAEDTLRVLQSYWGTYWAQPTWTKALKAIIYALMSKNQSLSNSVKDIIVQKFDISVADLKDIISAHIHDTEIFNTLKKIFTVPLTSSLDNDGGEEILDEEKSYSHKYMTEFEVPPQVKLLSQKEVEDFIKQMDPEEIFKVGYVTPMRFYTELNDKFDLVKATEMEGYTGIDYRYANVDAADADARREIAKQQIANNQNGVDKLRGFKLNPKGDKFSTAYRDTNKLALNPEKTNVQTIYATDEKGEVLKDANGKPIVANEIDMNKILFYPKVGSKPEVTYYLDLHDGKGFRVVERDLLVNTLYKKIVEVAEGAEAVLSETDKKWLIKSGYGADVNEAIKKYKMAHGNIPVCICRKAQAEGVDPKEYWKSHPMSPRWSLDDFIAKAGKWMDADNATIMAQDAETVSGKELDQRQGMSPNVNAGHLVGEENKPQVRALYSNQLYYLSGRPGTKGKEVSESLKEDFLDDLEADTNIYTVDGIDYNAEDLYAAIFDSIDSYRFDADNEDEYVEISQQEAEEIAHEAFYELTDSNCKKPIYEVVSDLLGLNESLTESRGFATVWSDDGEFFANCGGGKELDANVEKAKKWAVKLAKQYHKAMKVLKNGCESQVIWRCDADGNEINLTEEVNLEEAKRYVKRYYVRPQNIFCSNKEDILKALLRVDGENCSIYSLKNLSDHDDVQELQPSDIIYYYDDGILYDKNHVKVMDYDLNVKHEEERKKFANVDAAPEAQVNDVYDDRLTDADLKDKEAVANFRAINTRQMK